MGAKAKPRTKQAGRKPEAKHAGGRPTKYTKKLAEMICQQIAHGHGLKGICQGDGMPAAWTVYRWLRMEEHAEFRGMYAQAREQQQEYWADEIIEIADDAKSEARLRPTTRWTYTDRASWLTPANG